MLSDCPLFYELLKRQDKVCDLKQYADKVRNSNPYLLDFEKKQNADTVQYIRFRPFHIPFLATLLNEYHQAGCVIGVLRMYIPMNEQREYGDAYFIPVERRNNDCFRNTFKFRYQVLDIALRMVPVIDIDDYRTNDLTQFQAPEEFLVDLQGSGHSNMLLIDNKKKQLELIEPNGHKADWVPAVRKGLERFLKLSGGMFRNYRFAPVDESCPRRGPQYVAYDERCASWNLLMTALRLLCPDFSLLSIGKQLSDFGQANLLQLQQIWACFCWEFIDQHGMIEVWNWMEPRNLDETTRPVQTQFLSGRPDLALRLIPVVERFEQLNKAKKVDSTYERIQQLVIQDRKLTDKQKEAINLFMGHSDLVQDDSNKKKNRKKKLKVYRERPGCEFYCLRNCPSKAACIS